MKINFEGSLDEFRALFQGLTAAQPVVAEPVQPSVVAVEQPTPAWPSRTPPTKTPLELLNELIDACLTVTEPSSGLDSASQFSSFSQSPHADLVVQEAQRVGLKALVSHRLPPDASEDAVNYVAARVATAARLGGFFELADTFQEIS